MGRVVASFSDHEMCTDAYMYVVRGFSIEMSHVFMLGANAFISEYQLICNDSSYVLDNITEIVPLESLSFNFNS